MYFYILNRFQYKVNSNLNENEFKTLFETLLN